MAVIGIAHRNAVIGNPYPQNRASGTGRSQGFDDAYLYGAATTVKETVPTFVNKDIDPLKVDPRNASYEEIQALNEYLVGKGWLKEEELNSFEHPTGDDKEKADYYNALRKWRDIQYQAGNMVGYKNAAKVCDAWSNAIRDMEGKTQYMYMDGSSPGGIVDAKEKDAYGDAVRVYYKEGQLTCPSLGFGSLEDGTRFEVSYDDSSTTENPVIRVRVKTENGTEKIVKVNVNQVDPTNATQLEMLALLSHMDAQGKSGNDEMLGSYRDLVERAKNSSHGDMSAKNAQDFIGWKQNWRDMTLGTENLGSSELAWQALAKKRVEADDGVPYSYLAKDGIIDYKGVIFVCDTKRKALCLGDMSDPKKCLQIPLSGGGSLIVNRDNLGDLAKAIGMFSPEDVNLILRAIAEDAKIQQMKQQIDDETSGLELAENTGEQGTEADADADAEAPETVVALTSAIGMPDAVQKAAKKEKE